MKKIAAAACAAALFTCGVAAQFALAKRNPAGAPVVGESMVAALGGLRSIAAEVVWLRADRLQDQGRFGELVQLSSMLTFLEPHEPEVWIYSAWNMAYNISVRMPRLEDRWPWVYEGVRLLRDQGIKWNPSDAKLYAELATLFQLKIGLDHDTASPIYRAEWRKVVDDIAARGAWNELSMDPAIMSELERLYGIDDWANPQASAIYWAHRGLAVAGSEDASLLETKLGLSRRLYSKPVKKLEDI